MAEHTQRNLTDKTAIVTGASKNMGRAFAAALAARGTDVVVHYHSDKSKSDAEESARIVKENGSRALLVSGDLAQPDAVESLFKSTEDAFGKIDIVINTAGIVIKRPFIEYTVEEFDRSFAVNSKAAFLVMQQAGKKVQDGGRIINMGTSLLGAFTGYYGVYAGSKAPLEDFTRALAKEIGHRGVTVNTVAPGPIDTPFFHGEENEQSVNYLKAASVANRLGEIDDIVPVIEFIASEESRWVTGQILFVNGGFVTR